MAQIEKQIIKFTGISGFFVLLSRVTGYIRDRGLAYFLGTSPEADAFLLAYRIPNLLRRFTAEGAMTVAFIPVFTRLKERAEPKDLWDFASRFFFSLVLLTACIASFGSLAAPLIMELIGPRFHGVPGQFELAVLLLRIMFPYILLVSAAAVLQGILNSLRVFGIPASTTIFFNLSVVVCLVLVVVTAGSEASDLRGYAIAASVGVVIGGFLQFGVQVPSTCKRGFHFQPALGFRHPAVREAFRKTLPGMAGAGVIQIKALIGASLATYLFGGAVSSLFYAERLMELTLGIFTVSLATVVLPFLSKSAVDRNVEEFKKTLVFSVRQVIFVIVPASAGLALLARPIVKVLFQGGHFSSLSVEYTVAALCSYTLGMLAFSMVRISSQAFYSIQEVKTPMIVAGVTVGLCVVLMFVLVLPLEHAGIAMATSLAGYFNLLVLFILLRRRVGALGLSAARRTAAITLASTAVMVLFVFALSRLVGLEEGTSLLIQALLLLLVMTAGVAVYAGTAWLLGSEDLAFYLRLLGIRSLP